MVNFGLIDTPFMGSILESNVLQDVIDIFFPQTGAFRVTLNRVLGWKNKTFGDGGLFQVLCPPSWILIINRHEKAGPPAGLLLQTRCLHRLISQSFHVEQQEAKTS